MKLSTLQVLSDVEIQQIHDATIDILENCGVKIGSDRMLSFLKEKGLKIDADKRVAYFSKSCIEDALSKIPPHMDVFNRDGSFAFTLGDGIPKIAAGHNAVFWQDSETGQRRPSKISDVELFAKMCDQLETIHMIGIPVMPQDVPDPMASLLYGVKAVVENSKKPIYFSTDSAKVNRACIDLLEAVFEGDFKSQVYGITQLSPTSPLFWEGNVLDAIMDTVNTAVPISILPEPIAGISSPYTLAGLLTVNNAECLSGLVMIQMLRPGTKVMYANSWTTTDMRTGSALVGSTETTLCRIAAAQLAKFYKTPSHTTAPNSDNHAHDEQNSWEKTLSLYSAVAAGHDLIVNCGMFATGMTCSHEQLILDEEIASMCKRISAGINVCKDTITAEVVKEVGHGGDYLMSEHTLEWLKSDEYLTPRISVRGPYATWQAEGCRDAYMRAKESVHKFAQNATSPISPESSARMREIVADFSKV